MVVERYDARRHSFLPDPYVEPIVVKTVVLRPKEPKKGAGVYPGPYCAHVSVLLFPQCQIALVACGDHLPYGGPRGSFDLTDERWMHQFTKVQRGQRGRACLRCLRRLKVALSDEQRPKYLAWREEYGKGGAVPDWITEALERDRLRMPLVVHEASHPFWSQVRFWQWQRRRAANGGGA